MIVPQAQDLHSLRSGIRTMYTSSERSAAELRAAHLAAVGRLTVPTMLGNIGSATVMLWGFRDELTPGLWLWWLVLLTVTGVALANWWARRGYAPEMASTRAVHRATRHAFVLAGLWALATWLWFPHARPEQQLMIGTLITGLLSAGSFVLSPLPLASITFAGLLTAGALGGIWLDGRPELGVVALLQSLYSPIVMLGAVLAWRKSAALLQSQAEAVRQERTVAVLLQDFEQNANEALWETGSEGLLRHHSPRLAELLGVPAQSLQQEPLVALLEQRCSGAGGLRRALDAGRPFRDLPLTLGETDAHVADEPTRRHLTINGKRLVDDKGRTLGWRGVLADVSDKVEAEVRLRQLAHTDSLTGLANRFTLRDVLAEHLAAGRRGALLAIDLDHFKAVNDSLGHSAGDELLKAVSRRLRDCVRPGDLVARLGGDEFAVVMTHSGAAEDAEHLARRLVQALTEPVDVQGRLLRAGASVGVALWAGQGEAVDALLVRADTALYAAKEGGRGHHVLYSSELGERSRRRADLEEGLRLAVQRQELSLHWQPKVQISTWQVASAEALMRWQHPTLGRVNPGEFIEVAEQCGLIDDLGEWALQEACRSAAQGLQGLAVSVNVSPLQLRSGRFVALVRDALREHRLPPGLLELEITESVFIGDAEAALEQLHALRALGVRVALDDFGTGYSSLAYLRRFPFDTLKIDRAFVSEVLLRRDARAIVHMIANLAATLGMRTVCEGVETAQQLAAVTEAGCDEIQGYLVSPPKPLADFRSLLRDWHDRPPAQPSALH